MKRLLSLSAIAFICALFTFTPLANAKQSQKYAKSTSQSVKTKKSDPFVKFLVEKFKKTSKKKTAHTKTKHKKRIRRNGKQGGYVSPANLKPGKKSFLSVLFSGKKKTKAKIRKTRIGGHGKATRFNKIIVRHAKANGVPIKLAKAVIKIESNFRPNARGGVGEIGLMQLRFGTAKGMGYRGSKRALYHPETNIKYGMKYLGKAHRLARGSLCGTILKYNAGHGAKRMNPISANYCRKVKRVLARG